MLELKQSTCWREKFKHVQILPVPSVYILELIMFVIKNLNKCQTNASVHTKDTRQKNQQPLHSVKLASIQNRICCSSKECFNKLPLDCTTKWQYSCLQEHLK